jgi:hypothetical protein
MNFVSLISGIALFLVVIAIVKVSLRNQRVPAEQEKHKQDVFTAKPLMNESEIRLLAALDDLVPTIFGSRARVFTQVSYGEFLKCDTRGGFMKVNQKRADFVVADLIGTVLSVVEYQGSGHYGKTLASKEDAQKRDRVKRTALASAGIPLCEVPAKYKMEELRALLILAKPV